MNIQVFGTYYAPEPTGIGPYTAGLCEYLVERGHSVTAVVAFPNYPHWRKQQSDCGQLYRSDALRGVAVLRCWQYVPRRVSTAKRIVHELTFAFTSFFRGLSLRAPDIYIVVSPPLILGATVWVLARLKRRQFVFHVQDLQPDAAVGLGMMKRGLFTKVLYKLEALAYEKAVAVSGISRGMLDAYTQKGVPESKHIYFPNWARPTPAVGATAGRHCGSIRLKYRLPANAVLAFYSGNLGKKQGLDLLLQAARLIAAKPAASAHIVIAGNGVARPQLEADLQSRPCRSVSLLPLLSDEDYRAMLTAADICLITQLPGTGQMFFPSKLLSILEARRPVIAVADESSDLSRAVREGEFGEVLPPGDAEALADRLCSLSCERERLAAWALRTSWVKQFGRDEVLSSFEHRLVNLTKRPVLAESPNSIPV